MDADQTAANLTCVFFLLVLDKFFQTGFFNLFLIGNHTKIIPFRIHQIELRESITGKNITFIAKNQLPFFVFCDVFAFFLDKSTALVLFAAAKTGRSAQIFLPWSLVANTQSTIHPAIRYHVLIYYFHAIAAH